MRVFCLRILTFICLNVNIVMDFVTPVCADDHNGLVPSCTTTRDAYVLPIQNSRVVINELMVDPTPMVGLPDLEWIELVNISGARVNLEGWELRVGSTSRLLSACWVEPGDYVILCDEDSAEALAEWGQVLGFQMPALRNSGNRVTLLSTNGEVEDEVNYSDSWYPDIPKRNGGWSLERIDPDRSCGEHANWTVSMDPSGGTPGKQNSVFAANPDEEIPGIKNVGVVSPNLVVITFTEPVVADSSCFYLSGGLGTPDRLEFLSASVLHLIWDAGLPLNVTLQLTTQGISDLCGNSMPRLSSPIQWIQLGPGDVVVNEILFNPLPGGCDFVEVLNRSSKRVDAGLIQIAGRDNLGELRQKTGLGTTGVVLEPGDLMAVCVSKEGITTFYTTVCESCIHEIPSIPSYNNGEGWVVLLDGNERVIDEFHYTEEMHHPLIGNVKGVSLERSNPDLDASAPGNIHSASAAVGFATPGYKNSQSIAEPSRKASLAIRNPTFSPNDDGYNDQLVIHYTMPSQGWMANAWIFDLSGTPMVTLAGNLILSTEGDLVWDGSDPTGSMLPPGPYVLMIEMYDLEGHIDRFREAVVLTGQWD